MYVVLVNERKLIPIIILLLWLLLISNGMNEYNYLYDNDDKPANLEKKIM